MFTGEVNIPIIRRFERQLQQNYLDNSLKGSFRITYRSIHRNPTDQVSTSPGRILGKNAVLTDGNRSGNGQLERPMCEAVTGGPRFGPDRLDCDIP